MVEGQKLKVFISYSRRDSSGFADELVAGLELAGFAPFLDRHDIAAGEDWEARLSGLIQSADTVIFVVSPGAVTSERCGWEAEKAVALSKRLLPVVYLPIPEPEIPERLRRLQFVRFDTAPSVTKPLLELAEALRQDLEWIREHTRLGELTARWQTRGRPESMLLRGDDLDAAKAWAANRKSEAPEITELQRAFLTASEAAEAARGSESRSAKAWTRWMQALAGLLVVGIVAGLVAWLNERLLTEYIYWLIHVRGNVITAEQLRGLDPGHPFKECTDCPEMLVVPAGKFTMGSPATEAGHDDDEAPQHQVMITKPFAVSKFDVSFDEWDACAVHGDCDAHITGIFGRGRQPVMNISWDDAQTYVAWLSRVTGKTYRLLTEAEWEYAARAGSTTAYYWGDEIGSENANCFGCGGRWGNSLGTSPVGSFKPNAFGLYDMAGNVYQWVQDCYHEGYEGAPTDGSVWPDGHCRGRRARGGSYGRKPEGVRSAHRNGGSPNGKYFSIGLRVGRTLTP